MVFPFLLLVLFFILCVSQLTKIKSSEILIRNRVANKNDLIYNKYVN